MEKIRMAIRMKREYCSAVSLTVWVRVWGGEGWESMLAMLFRVISMFCMSLRYTMVKSHA